MVVFNTGVTYAWADDNRLPPAAASYQAYPPGEPDALNMAVSPEQIVTADAEGAFIKGWTVTVTAARALTHAD